MINLEGNPIRWSEMWRHAEWSKFSDVSEEITAKNFHQATVYHFTEYYIPHSFYNLKYNE
jgi:hypothetical protein